MNIRFKNEPSRHQENINLDKLFNTKVEINHLEPIKLNLTSYLYK